MKGFSLVELLVTVAIIAIISVGSMASFNLVGDILRVKQGAGLLKDMIHQADGQILRGEYKKITIRFLKDYLVMEYETEDAHVEYLSWTGNKITIAQGGALFKQDGVGRQLSVESVVAGDIDISNFQQAPEDGWSYQLKNGNEWSSTIALRHFNVNRENASIANNPLELDPTDIILTIEAPYAKRRVTGASTLLTIRDKNNKQAEQITIQ